MQLSRRGFLAGIIAAAVAPAIVRSGLIMPIKPKLIVPEEPRFIWGDTANIHTSGPGSFTITGTDIHGNLVTEVIQISSAGMTRTKNHFSSILDAKINTWSSDTMVGVAFKNAPLRDIQIESQGKSLVTDGLSRQEIKNLSQSVQTFIKPEGLSPAEEDKWLIG